MEEQWRGQGLNAQEIETIVRLTNALLPFTIPMQNATKKPGYGLPLVVLSNCLLQIAGYGDFTSEISPMPSAAAVYPLRLNATGVYEVFLSGDNFKVSTGNGRRITSKEIANRNKTVTLAQVFDMEAIDSRCESHGMAFDNCVTVCPDRTAVLAGSAKDSGKLKVSAYEERDRKRKDNSSQPDKKAGDNPGVVDEAFLKQIDGRIETLKEELKDLNANKRRANKEYAQVKNKAGVRTQEIKAKRGDRAEATLQANRKKVQLKDQRARRREVELGLRNSGCPQRKDTVTPRFGRRFVEDDADHMDLSKLKEETQQTGKQFVCSGTDYGLCTLSTTVAVTEKRLKYHLELFNRFQVLADDKVAMEVDDEEEMVTQDTYCITAENLREKTLCNKISRLREKRKVRFGQ